MNPTNQKRVRLEKGPALGDNKGLAAARISAAVLALLRREQPASSVPEAGQEATYHVTSSTVGDEMLFGDEEKDVFCGLMRRQERFAEVEILTFAVTGNQFDLLVRVPDRQKLVAGFDGKGGEDRLLAHLKEIYSDEFLDCLRRNLDRLRKAGKDEHVRQVLARFTDRIRRLQPFMKELKVGFSRCYNKRHGRRGTMWMERYKSVIVEGRKAERTVALHIDSIPLRLGLCEDPKDYRWCGYAEAVGGSRRARRGLCRVMGRPLDSWGLKPSKGGPTASKLYRSLLLNHGSQVPDVASMVRRKKKGEPGGGRRGRRYAFPGVAGGRGE